MRTIFGGDERYYRLPQHEKLKVVPCVPQKELAPPANPGLFWTIAAPSPDGVKFWVWQWEEGKVVVSGRHYQNGGTQRRHAGLTEILVSLSLFLITHLLLCCRGQRHEASSQQQ